MICDPSIGAGEGRFAGMIFSSAGVAVGMTDCIDRNSSAIPAAISLAMSREISGRICLPRSVSHSSVGTTTTDVLPVLRLSSSSWQLAVVMPMTAIAAMVKNLLRTLLHHFVRILLRQVNDKTPQIFTGEFEFNE